MRKNNKIRIEQIVARLTKGYAFTSFPKGQDKTADDFYNRIDKEVENDFISLSESEFRSKYKNQIY